jgi:hypothetical protein
MKARFGQTMVFPNGASLLARAVPCRQAVPAYRPSLITIPI